MLIKDGILVGYMNNRESAERFNMVPTGNARAYLFSDEPLIRMRNTAVLPGKSKLEDMIASIDDGYYLLDTNNGQADTTGEFMFGVTFGPAPACAARSSPCPWAWADRRSSAG